MSDALSHFPPSLAEARARLAAFVPHAGADYARRRNFDRGAGRHDNVSGLSPYLRSRLLDEIDVSRAVLARHSATAADKFLTELFWRTYWKGWMELRPAVWTGYRQALDRLRDDIQTQAGLRQRWQDACAGQTGIAPFDVWAQELAATGYLHNHARMWFASIWIFTLELPWELGADFFLRHLLDGDAAVNTLSWRWVAGIQTRGKTYLAAPDNIATFTEGRFVDTRGLARSAHPVSAAENPPPRPLPVCETPELSGRYGIVIHDNDTDLARLLVDAPDPAAIAYVDSSAGHSPWRMAPHVADFRTRLALSAAAGRDIAVVTDTAALDAWASAQGLDRIVAAYAPAGPTQAILHGIESVPLALYRRPLDDAAWPLATKGFFPFRKHIPDLIGEFVPT